MEEGTVTLFSSAAFAVPAYAGAIFLIYNLIGWQAATGVFFLCILIPYFAVLSYANTKLRGHSYSVRSANLPNESSSFGDRHGQNACVGGRIWTKHIRG